MKAIKIIILITFTLSTAWQLHAQNWKIFNPEYIYNFQYSDSEYYLSNSLWADSVEVQGSDSILYLNRRAVRDSIYLLANQPHFLQRKAVITDSLVYFYDTASFVMKRNFDVGGSWLFDTSNNITASCTDKYSGLTFGNADSIKVILLSNNDTILLSKNYGILQFPEFETDERYSLKGIDNQQIGECSPKFADFFTFEVGDVFVYKKLTYIQNDSYDELYKYTVLDILNQIDTFSYVVKHEKWFFYFYMSTPYSESGFTIDTIALNFAKSDNRLTEFYNDQPISNYDEVTSAWIQQSANSSYYSVSNIFIDENSLVTKSIGCHWENCWNESVFIETQTSYIYTSENLSAFYRQQVKSGIGLVLENRNIWESIQTTRLIAWHTQNSSFGNLDTLSWWMSQAEIEAQRVSVYPNPSSGTVLISGLQNSPFQLSLFDISGKHILQKQIESSETTIQLDGIRDGVYILVLRNQHETIRKRLIVSKE